MILRSLFAALLIVIGLSAFGLGNSETPSPTPSAVASPSPPKPLRPAPSKERLAAARSVQVQTDILGIRIDSSLDAAHAILDSLCDSAHRPKEGADDAERSVLWQLAKSDFSSVFVKADDKERVTYIAGFLRPGKGMPFEKIGQIDMAPVLTDSTVAWDVVRPDQPLIRVVARGEKRKASSITVFIVKRPPAR